MAGRGKPETEALIANVTGQLDRLLCQLQDLDECRDDLDDDEYEETRAETVAQLAEFEESLKKMMSGDVSLVDKMGVMQLAIQGAISEAFKTPEVIRMFANKKPGDLRVRLAQVQRDQKLGKINNQRANGESVEILAALRKLGEQLSASESEFLLAHSSEALDSFHKVARESEAAGDRILANAGAAVRQAQH